MSDTEQSEMIEIQPFKERWIAAESTEGVFVVVPEPPEGVDPTKTPQYALAECPHPQIAEYIAHAHNTVLMMSTRATVVMDALLGRTPAQAGDDKPAAPETGGYL